MWSAVLILQEAADSCDQTENLSNLDRAPKVLRREVATTVQVTDISYIFLLPIRPN